LLKCKLYHTGVRVSDDGVIKNNLVYLEDSDSNLYFPEEMFMAKEECEGGLIQFEVNGKWGFADIYTGEIKIEPKWDYAGPFYRGYAQVAIGNWVEHHQNGQVEINGGKHGYIDTTGKIAIRLEYDNAYPISFNGCFLVSKNRKKGVVDNQNRIKIALEWDVLVRDGYLLFVAMEEPCDLYIGAEDKLVAEDSNIDPISTCDSRLKWGVFDLNCDLLIKPELDERPYRYSYFNRYYILKRKRRFGVLSEYGALISDITLFKRDAVALIKKLST